jgi:hypothetical protein
MGYPVLCNLHSPLPRSPQLWYCDPWCRYC